MIIDYSTMSEYSIYVFKLKTCRHVVKISGVEA